MPKVPDQPGSEEQGKGQDWTHVAIELGQKRARQPKIGQDPTPDDEQQQLTFGNLVPERVAKEPSDCGRGHAVERAFGQAIQVGRGDWAAVAFQMPVTRVIQHDEQHIGRAIFGPVWFRPGR